jgi:hypothetical protein
MVMLDCRIMYILLVIENTVGLYIRTSSFNYLGCELSLDGEPDFVKKINRLQRTCGTIRKHLKKTGTDTQMQFNKFVARPTLLYSSETWVTTK